MSTAIVVIGLGNRYRGDDAAGLCVAASLRSVSLPDVTVVEHEGNPIDLIDQWSDAKLVVLIDATASAVLPGTIQRFDARQNPLPAESFRVSTHAVSLAEVIELARAIGAIPPKLIVYGIEGATFATGEGISPRVQQAIDDVAERVQQDIITFSCHKVLGDSADAQG